VSFDLARLPARTASFEFDIPWPTSYAKQQAVLAWPEE
jgi:hypothetical protein